MFSMFTKSQLKKELKISLLKPGPDLPFPQYAHCAVKLGTGKVMIIGGIIGWGQNETSQSVIIFDPNTKTFDQSLPSLNYDRYGLGCAVFKSALHDNREVVLAVGGYSQATAEVYDYTHPNTKWTNSKYFNKIVENCQCLNHTLLGSGYEWQKTMHTF